MEDSGLMLERCEVKVDMSTLRRRGPEEEGLMLCSTVRGGVGWLVMRREERSLWERDGGWEIGGERAYLHTGSPF